MDRYNIPPTASILNFKNIVNGFTEESGYQSYINKIRNIKFDEKRNGSMFAWIGNGFDIDNPVSQDASQITYHFLEYSFLEQDLFLKPETYYTMVLELEYSNSNAEVQLIVNADETDFLYNSSPTDEIIFNLSNGTNVIRFKTRDGIELTSSQYFRIFNSLAGEETDVSIKNISFTEGRAALLNAEYNEFEKLIRWNNTDDYWEISIDEAVTWERIWTESSDFDDKITEIVNAQVAALVHQDNILAGPGVTITPSFIEDPMDPLVQWPALTIGADGASGTGGGGDWTREDVVYQSLLEHSDFSYISYNTLVEQGNVVLNGASSYSDQADEFGVGRIYGGQTDGFETANLLESGASSNSSFYIHYVANTDNISAEYSFGNGSGWSAWTSCDLKEVVIASSNFTELRIRLIFDNTGITTVTSFGVLYGHESIAGQLPLGFLEIYSGNVSTGTYVQIPSGEWYHKDGKSLEVFYDGIRMLEGVDYTETDVGFSDKSNAVQFTFDLVSSSVVVFKEIYGNPESTQASGNVSWTNATDGYVSASFEKLMIDTSSASVTIYTPPAPSIGDEIQLIDKHGTFNINNLFIDGGTTDIMNQQNPWPIGDNFAHVTLVYVDNSVGWRVYHYYSFTS